jgi:hypothetical protein
MSYYVYLNLKENKIYILDYKRFNIDWSLLYKKEGFNSITECKSFALGFIMGSVYDKPINSLSEFF